jgi:hypothetical protein
MIHKPSIRPRNTNPFNSFHFDSEVTLMLDTLRKPFFIIAVVLLVLAVLAELGSGFYIDADGANASEYSVSRPGWGIAYLAILDGLLLFTIALIGAPLIIPDRIHGRIQGIITFVVSLLILIGSIVMIVAALLLLMLMVSLLLAIPFGTIVYMAKYADFDKTAAAITLSFIMSLKLGFTVFLVLAHQRFLENKGLVLIILTSFLATIILSFLHGLVPGFLASITDDIGAIIVAVLTAIWALFYLIGSIPAIIKALRVDKALT